MYLQKVINYLLKVLKNQDIIASKGYQSLHFDND